jgi:hypothetical protein
MRRSSPLAVDVETVAVYLTTTSSVPEPIDAG